MKVMRSVTVVILGVWSGLYAAVALLWSENLGQSAGYLLVAAGTAVAAWKCLPRRPRGRRCRPAAVREARGVPVGYQPTMEEGL